jgi:GDP-L-fucose synthase
MKILILGGFGFVGSRLNFFLKKKNRVIQASRRNGLDLFNLKKTIKYINKVKPDIIINCAVFHGGLNYINSNPATIFNQNSKIYFNTYEAISRSNCNPLIFNLISNCAYYHKLNLQKEKNWLDGEAHESVQPFAVSKRISYYLSNFYFKEFGINTKNLIIPNAYGPGDHLDPKRTHALNGIIIRFIKNIKDKKELFEIWGSGKPKREWIYVDDIARLISLEIEKKQIPMCLPMNLAQNKSYSILEIANKVKKILKSNIVLKTDKSKIDGAPLKQLDNNNFKKYFGNFNFYPIEDGISRTIKYYQDKLK